MVYRISTSTYGYLGSTYKLTLEVRAQMGSALICC